MPILISLIINKSFLDDVFPDKQKLSKIIPFFKSGEKNIRNNYRPISILPNFSKIFEKILHRRILSYIDKNCILNRKNLCTSHALLDHFQYLYDSLDDSIIVYVLYSLIFEKHLIDLTIKFFSQNYNIMDLGDPSFVLSNLIYQIDNNTHLSMESSLTVTILLTGYLKGLI